MSAFKGKGAPTRDKSMSKFVTG
jgi:Leucine-rich repeat (LRR) protein